MKRFIEGFSLGMVLQVAVGPVCLAVFSLGTSLGIFPAWTGAMGAVTADILFVFLALFGVGSLIRKPRVQKVFQVGGAILIALFGMELLLSPWGISFFPKFGALGGGRSPFFEVLLITLSNPMAILFWIGVFSVKISEIQGGVYSYAAGAIFATFIFLSFVAVAAGYTRSFLPRNVLNIINAAAGLVLIFFALSRLVKRSV